MRLKFILIFKKYFYLFLLFLFINLLNNNYFEHKFNFLISALLLNSHNQAQKCLINNNNEKSLEKFANLFNIYIYNFN